MIPDKCHGWIRVEYGVAGAPPLSRTKTSEPYGAEVSATCLLRTSIELTSGLARDEYYSLKPNGQRSVLPVSRSPTDHPQFGIQQTIWTTTPELPNRSPRHLKALFVGSYKEFQNAPKDDQSVLGR